MASKELATLGGGCYWCLEAYYQRIEGISSVISGYSGGHLNNPTTEQVYTGMTGHAEVVQLEFDPTIISFNEILEIFFVMHDPTTLNKQENDIGEHYRSVIFYHSDKQKQIATELKNGYASNLWKDPIVTQIVSFNKFWPADETMQDFYNKYPGSGYCMIIIDPKIQKLRQKFAKKLKKTD